MRSIRWAISAIAFLVSAPLGAAPSVTLVAPAPGVRYVAPAAIELAANPTVDAGMSIDRVEFLADGNIIGVATQAPYTFSWTDVARGNYNLRARVYDSAGVRDASPVVRVHVRNNTAPRVRLSAPSTLHRPRLRPSQRRSDRPRRPDRQGRVLQRRHPPRHLHRRALHLRLDRRPRRQLRPRATATDTLGATGTSNLFRVRVRDNAAPHVRILTPDNRETFPTPASIAVSLKANDRDDNLTNVELFANGSSLAVFTGPLPYEFSWTNVTPGTYALTALATDDLGLTTTSRS